MHLLKKLHIPAKQKRFIAMYEYVKKKDEDIKMFRHMVKFFEGSEWPEKHKEYQRKLRKARKQFDVARNTFLRTSFYLDQK
jgi:hypothetical protein